MAKKKPDPDVVMPPVSSLSPCAQNPTAIPADLTPLVPQTDAPTTGAEDLDAVKEALESGVPPPG